MPNPKQNDDGTLDEGMDANDTVQQRQPQRVNQADEAVEEEQDDDLAVAIEGDEDDEVEDDDDDDDDDELDDAPGIQRD